MNGIRAEREARAVPKAIRQRGQFEGLWIHIAGGLFIGLMGFTLALSLIAAVVIQEQQKASEQALKDLSRSLKRQMPPPPTPAPKPRQQPTPKAEIYWER